MVCKADYTPAAIPHQAIIAYMQVRVCGSVFGAASTIKYT